jgi:peptidoglycan hydrolase-like protein with peptidoglycan-binding domain
VQEAAAPRVFISYSHDSDQHMERVLVLADRLRSDGVEAIIDQYVQSPAAGWPAWCAGEIRRANFVLMVCTETYRRRVDLEEEPGKGHGVLWEARLINQELYDAGSVSAKFVPVLLAGGSPEHVPAPVRGMTIYEVETEDGLERLCRLLLNQPATPPLPVGARKVRLPRARTTEGGGVKAEEARIEARTYEGLGAQKPAAEASARADTDTTQTIQAGLQQLGYDPGPMDGIVGARTRAAISQYQQYNGLLVNGEATARLCKHIYAGTIKSIQAGLQQFGYDPGPADGFAGPWTRAAIARYQQDNGLGVDGEPSRRLWSHIYSDTVQGVQAGLQQLGYDTGPADGIPGAKTRAAIARYQQDNGFVADGEPTSQVWSHIYARL